MGTLHVLSFKLQGPKPNGQLVTSSCTMSPDLTKPSHSCPPCRTYPLTRCQPPATKLLRVMSPRNHPLTIHHHHHSLLTLRYLCISILFQLPLHLTSLCLCVQSVVRSRTLAPIVRRPAKNATMPVRVFVVSSMASRMIASILKGRRDDEG